MRPTILHLLLCIFGMVIFAFVASFQLADEQCQQQGKQLVREPLEWVCETKEPK